MRPLRRSSGYMADPYPLSDKKIWVAGETGLVGRSLVAALQERGHALLSAPRSKLDLTDQAAAFYWLEQNRPDIIFVAAAKVGGIGANRAYPADFIRDNLAIAQNVIEGAHRAGVQRLVFLGSSCIYPREAAQPIREEALLTGPLESTNEAYAIAKIAGLKMCEFYRRQYGRDYFSVMPTNLYGPHDRFDAFASHVIPAIIVKFAEAASTGAREVVLWGSGAPLREFLHVEDLARALVHIAEHWRGENILNIGSGEEISIARLAELVAGVTGYRGRIVFDATKPDGTPRKFLDSSRILETGWKPKISLENGLRETYDWYRASLAAGRRAAS